MTPTRTADAPQGIGYLPGLDGLRAISVVAVIAYHLDLTWATGGYLGVEVFFVVSGYLITLLALDEQRRLGAFHRLAFWGRRARRLLPAVVVLISLVLAYAAVVLGAGELRRWRGDGIASLFYVQNWHLVVTDQPYFVSFGRPPPLRHLWSLAIEEQFYLLWPLFLPWSMRRFGRARTLQLTMAGAACSVLLMGALADIAAPERAYYGTDTRAFGVLMGCALAFAWRPDRFRTGLAAGPRHTLAVAGTLALLTLLWQFGGRSEFDPWTYPWGFVLVDLCTVALIIVATHPGSILRRILGGPAISALGRRSYSLYLWHWPVLVFTRPGIDWPLRGAPAFLARVALIAMLSEISYRWIEQPFRDGRARDAFRRTIRSARTEPRDAVLLATAVLLVSGLVVSVLAVPEPDQQVTVASPAVTIPLTPVTAAPSTTTTALTAPPAPVETAVPAPPDPGVPDPGAPVPEPPTTAAPAPPTTPPPPIPDVTVVGESVTVGAVPNLQEAYGPRVQIDASEGRSFHDGVAVIEGLAQAGQLTPTVVMHMGNNGAVPDEALNRIKAALGPDRRLLMINVRVPRRWEGQVNAALAEHAAAHEYATLVDWYSVSGSEPGLLAKDGVHLTDEGKRRYTALVLEATG